MHPVMFFLLMALLFPFPAKAVPWYEADRSSVGIAPLPTQEKRAIVQIYAARAWSWRGAFAIHSWIATKEKNADHYMVYQVVGWRQYRNLSVISIEPGIPDQRWYGNSPEMLFDLKGEAAEKMIPLLRKAADSYPYPNTYHLWPGPNSNSFTAHIIRHTPGMTVELPPHAIGKDWIDNGKFFGRSESGTGYQFSLFGALGLTIGLAEGIEINILGLTFGIDILRPALKLPFIGRVGLKDMPVFGPKAEPVIEKSPHAEDPHVTPGEIPRP